MTTEVRQRAQRRDRWVSWFVVGVFIIALILGWVIKSFAEGRSESYSVGGVTVEYPVGWVRTDVEDPILVQVEDRLVDPFRTTLVLQKRSGESLSAAQQALALDRGRNWSAYRSLQIEPEVSIGGRTGMRVTFAYVETNPNPFLETAPVVIMGEDFLFPAKDGSNVYVVTLTAAEENYDQAQSLLKDFVRSMKE